MTFEKVCASLKIVKTLYKVEEKHPGLVFNMRETFFPSGQLKEDEVARWEAYQKKAKDLAKKKQAKIKMRLKVRMRLLES